MIAGIFGAAFTILEAERKRREQVRREAEATARLREGLSNVEAGKDKEQERLQELHAGRYDEEGNW